MSRIRKGSEMSINFFFFFDRLHQYGSKYNIGPAQIWNLDKCEFKCSESSYSSWKIAPKEVQNHASYESSIDSTTVFKFIYLPETVLSRIVTTASQTEFIDSNLFLDWFTSLLRSRGYAKFQLLIAAHHTFRKKFKKQSSKKNHILLYLPVHMLNIIQPLRQMPKMPKSWCLRIRRYRYWILRTRAPLCLMIGVLNAYA